MHPFQFKYTELNDHDFEEIARNEHGQIKKLINEINSSLDLPSSHDKIISFNLIKHAVSFVPDTYLFEEVSNTYLFEEISNILFNYSSYEEQIRMILNSKISYGIHENAYKFLLNKSCEIFDNINGVFESFLDKNGFDKNDKSTKYNMITMYIIRSRFAPKFLLLSESYYILYSIELLFYLKFNINLS